MRVFRWRKDGEAWGGRAGRVKLAGERAVPTVSMDEEPDSVFELVLVVTWRNLLRLVAARNRGLELRASSPCRFRHGVIWPSD